MSHKEKMAARNVGGDGLCLNPTVQRDSRGVLVTSFRVKLYLEILGNSNMADCCLSLIRDQAVYNKTSMFFVYLSAYRIMYIE